MSKEDNEMMIESLRNQSEDQYKKIEKNKDDITSLAKGIIRMQSSLGYDRTGHKTGNGLAGSVETDKENASYMCPKTNKFYKASFKRVIIKRKSQNTHSSINHPPLARKPKDTPGGIF